MVLSEILDPTGNNMFILMVGLVIITSIICGAYILTHTDPKDDSDGR